MSQINSYLILGVLLGTVARTILPYLLANPKVKWEWQYLQSAISGAVLALAGGTLLMPSVDPTAPPLTLAIIGFMSAIALQDAARKVEKARRK